MRRGSRPLLDRGLRAGALLPCAAAGSARRNPDPGVLPWAWFLLGRGPRWVPRTETTVRERFVTGGTARVCQLDPSPEQTATPAVQRPARAVCGCRGGWL